MKFGEQTKVRQIGIVFSEMINNKSIMSLKSSISIVSLFFYLINELIRRTTIALISLIVR